MASTTTVNGDYCRVTIGKTLTPQSALTSRLKTAIICVTFDCAAAYSTGGEPVNLSADGRIDTIIEATVVGNSAALDGFTLRYRPDTCPANCATSGTLKVLQTGAVCMAATEIAACATTLNCETVKFKVTGF